MKRRSPSAIAELAKPGSKRNLKEKERKEFQKSVYSKMKRAKLFGALERRIKKVLPPIKQLKRKTLAGKVAGKKDLKEKEMMPFKRDARFRSKKKY